MFTGSGLVNLVYVVLNASLLHYYSTEVMFTSSGNYIDCNLQCSTEVMITSNGPVVLIYVTVKISVKFVETVYICTHKFTL